jgi:hypothetical protein
MKNMTDTELKIRGLRVLADNMGEVAAERFVALLQREPFDYTTWQRELWADRTIEDISAAAMEARRRSQSDREAIE